MSEEGANKVKEKWLILAFEVIIDPNINPHFSKLRALCCDAGLAKKFPFFNSIRGELIKKTLPGLSSKKFFFQSVGTTFFLLLTTKKTMFFINTLLFFFAVCFVFHTPIPFRLEFFSVLSCFLTRWSNHTATLGFFVLWAAWTSAKPAKIVT